MTSVTRYRLDSGYDNMGDCYCFADMEEDTDGEYVKFSDYMKLLREYAEYKQEVEKHAT